MKFKIKTLSLLFLVLTLSYGPVLFAEQTLDELEAEIESIKEQSAEQLAEQEEIKAEKADTEIELSQLKEEIDTINSNIATQEAEVASKNAEIETQKAKIAEIQAQIPEAKDETGKMLQVMQKAENGNILVELVLAPSEDGNSNILRRMDSVNDLSEYAGGVVVELIDIENELKYEETVLEKQKAELDQTQIELETEKKSLDAKQEELKEVLQSQSDSIGSLADSVEQSNEDQAMLEDTLAYYESLGCSGSDFVGSKCGDLADDDGDGIANGDDSCPNEYGEDTDGCPLPEVEVDTGGNSGGSSGGNSGGGSIGTASTFARPLSHGVVTTEFGGYSGHTGTDMDNADYDPILATADGIVITARGGCDPWGGYLGNYCNGGYGNYVMLMHSTSSGVVFSLYGHMSSITVSQGQTVYQGQQVGTLGQSGNSTGSHLHFEVFADANGNGLPDDYKTDARLYVDFPSYGVWW
ncbi:peptidoglycan DD-metalloendopeptidase family protein [Mollicutes bacterium LVI A0078]|nr:peptidoglycan DD-metalloendopeptidase family protein [Mollicutes bacterium LVI A0075]WOO90883.1 peptidoglycan DD-metalloendopeptidase family protein [Mollicutes bacterium LVI A0078]